MDVAEVEDGVGATGVDAWAGGTLLVDAWAGGTLLVDAWADGTIADVVAGGTAFDVWGGIAEADTETNATVVVLWPEIVNAATVLSFIIISYNKSHNRWKRTDGEERTSKEAGGMVGGRVGVKAEKVKYVISKALENHDFLQKPSSAYVLSSNQRGWR